MSNSDVFRPDLNVRPEPLDYPFNNHESLEVSARYKCLRDSPTLSRVRLPRGDPAWLVIDYDLARIVLNDPRFSSAAIPGRSVPRQSNFPADPNLLTLNDQDHTRLRGLITKNFTKKRIERLRPQVRAHARQLIAGMKDSGPPADLVENYAIPLTLHVICEILGVPRPDRARLRLWSEAQFSTNSLAAEETELRSRQLNDYLVGLVAARRAAPSDDLLTDLINAREDDDRLSEAELLVVTRELLFAGYETTSNQIANFTNFLTDRPDIWRSLRDEPQHLEATIEELLRFVPVMAGAGSMPRYALVDVVLGTTQIAAGDVVLVSIGASNRDGQEFPAPDVFRVDRDRNRHLAFGHGRHHCLGIALARLQLQEALSALALSFPNLSVGEIHWKNQVMRGPRTMMVNW
ncbi:hypothetical protein SD37_09285 [Amycolatopsis orientalis]|uniref:Cytochrome n=1 Tax=Amycolatopsis orientalis TaxID=31958 RepID=A0A193BUD1_AMYOR|nr:cytochrome P450 [Amycolatopsis orientalis]ANN15822.1 hypothetical protein SD37_09285 [Amycolatopsis orientalis]